MIPAKMKKSKGSMPEVGPEDQPLSIVAKPEMKTSQESLASRVMENPVGQQVSLGWRKAVSGVVAVCVTGGLVAGTYFLLGHSQAPQKKQLPDSLTIRLK